MPERKMPERRLPDYPGNPMDELRKIQHRLNRIVGEMNVPRPGEREVQVPHVDVREHGNEIIVTADLPGVSKEDIQIEVSGGSTLEITARRKEESQQEEKGYLRHERASASFYRAVQLPAEVDQGKAVATYTNGVLEITLPVTQRAKAKGVPIS